MMRKKAKKKKTAIKKTAAAPKKKGTPRGKNEQELNPAGVRKDISLMVEEEAALLARAVIDEGKKGQVGPVKFLFEMANIFPTTTDGSQTTTEEESMAQTLLRRLQIPLTPVAADEYDKECEDTKEIAAEDRDAKQASDDEKPVVAHAEESEEVPVG